MCEPLPASLCGSSRVKATRILIYTMKIHLHFKSSSRISCPHPEGMNHVSDAENYSWECVKSQLVCMNKKKVTVLFADEEEASTIHWRHCVWISEVTQRHRGGDRALVGDCTSLSVGVRMWTRPPHPSTPHPTNSNAPLALLQPMRNLFYWRWETEGVGQNTSRYTNTHSLQSYLQIFIGLIQSLL